MEVVSIIIVLLLVGAVVSKISREWSANQSSVSELEAYRDRNCPIFVQSEVPFDSTLEVRRQWILDKLSESGNQILTARDVHVIAWEGVHEGKSLASFTPFQYEMYCTKKRMEILTKWQMRVSQADKNAEADLRGQTLEYNWKLSQNQ